MKKRIKSIRLIKASNFGSIPQGSIFHLPECCTTYYKKQGSSAIRIKDGKNLELQPDDQVFIH